VAVNRPTGSSSSHAREIVHDGLAWEPCAVQAARTVLRRGEYREVPTYATAAGRVR